MLSITDIRLEGLATHYAGNKASGDDLILSGALVDIDTMELKSILLQYFLTPFQEAASFNFSHPSDLKLNEIYHYASAIFDDPASLMRHSCNIARQLYDATNLPNIKSGEVHIAYFKGCPINGVMTDAVGIYKTESKDQFLKITQDGKRFLFAPEEGIDPKRMDKGCLIFNIQRDSGFVVHVIDKTNKSSEAQFWKDIFLKVRAASDDYHATHDYLKLCKDFIVEQIPSEYEVSKVEQIDFLNKSVDYFKKNEQFRQEDFEQAVFQQPELIESFRSYGRQYQEDHEVDLSKDFDISSSAVKKQSRVFKSVLKLDRNFHVYVHGDRDLIEKGYDEAVGMSYYKIYFKEET